MPTDALAALLGPAPPGVVLVALAYLVVASVLVLLSTPHRPLQYPFAFGAFALFLVVGPRAAWVVAAATLAGAALRLAGRLVARRRRRAAAAGPLAMAVVGAAIIVGFGAGHLVARALDLAYPLPIAHARGLGHYMAVQCSAYAAFVATKEALGLVLLRARPAPRAVDRGLSIYLAGLVFGAPIQLAAHALYRPGEILPWTLALLWALLVNEVLARQVERQHRHRELARALAARERLAAIGEVSARVLHHTRHQIGLVGMITHALEQRLGRGPDVDREAVRADLARLATVHDDLVAALQHELSGLRPASDEAPVPAPADFPALVERETARLALLAEERQVRVALVVDGARLAARGPHRPERVAQAYANVLENAIAAARTRVDVTLEADGDAVRLRVVDDGPGMPDELLGRATLPFVTTKPGGSGMGLAITRAVVDEEDGTLELTSGPRGGLIVTLRLPAHGLTARCRSGPAARRAASDPAPRASAGSA